MAKNKKGFNKRAKTELKLNHFAMCRKCGEAYAVIGSEYCVRCGRIIRHKNKVLLKYGREKALQTAATDKESKPKTGHL